MMASSLEFPAESDDGATQCIDVSIMEDTVFEGDETFTVTLSSTNPRVMLENDETTVTITDDEGQAVQRIVTTMQ